MPKTNKIGKKLKKATMKVKLKMVKNMQSIEIKGAKLKARSRKQQIKKSAR